MRDSRDRKGGVREASEVCYSDLFPNPGWRGVT